MSTLGERTGRPTARTSRTGLATKRENDVEVVDHEVEDDVDVERARGEDAEAMGLEEHGLEEVLAGGGDGGVEALEVAGLDDAVVLAA